MERPITYGFHIPTQKMIFIDTVESGLECNCICPNCGIRMLARKGEKNMHHFAHLNEHECVGAYESMIHQLAKQILLDRGVLYFPEYEKYGMILPAKKVILENISIEKYHHNSSLRPDLLGYYNNIEFWIEFCYRHKVSPNKRIIIQEQNKECIEIYLDKQDENSLIDFLENSPLSRIWINHPSGDDEINLLKDKNISEYKNLLDNPSSQIRIYAPINGKSINNLSKTVDIQKKSYSFNPRFCKKPKDCPRKGTLNIECKTCNFCQFLEYDHKGIAEILCSYPHKISQSVD